MATSGPDFSMAEFLAGISDVVTPGVATGTALHRMEALASQVLPPGISKQNELGVRTECGGLEVARTEERMEELRRRMSSAKAWGIDSRLVTPAEIKELVPFINEEILLGGFYTPSVSCVDSLETGTQMRNEEKAKVDLLKQRLSGATREE